MMRCLILLFLIALFSCTSNPAGKSPLLKNNGSDIHKINTTKQYNSEMVYFKGGIFLMGSAQGSVQEQPEHKVEVNSFKIDKYPVTVKEFRRFIETTGYKTDAEKFGNSGVFDFVKLNWILQEGANWQYPLGKNLPPAEENHPVTQVSWNDATAYAAWNEKRLPSEAEWEYAARCGGKSNSKFSWGNDVIINKKYMANIWQGSDLYTKQGADGYVLTSPVGSFGETPCGLSDMGGNVWNWCADIYQPYLGNNTPSQINPEVKVIRGGSFFFDQSQENSYSTTGRSSNTQETSLFNTGFRCAQNAE